jgi:hypothetical protein
MESERTEPAREPLGRLIAERAVRPLAGGPLEAALGNKDPPRHPDRPARAGASHGPNADP